MHYWIVVVEENFLPLNLSHGYNCAQLWTNAPPTFLIPTWWFKIEITAPWMKGQEELSSSDATIWENRKTPSGTCIVLCGIRDIFNLWSDYTISWGFSIVSSITNTIVVNHFFIIEIDRVESPQYSSWLSFVLLTFFSAKNNAWGVWEIYLIPFSSIFTRLEAVNGYQKQIEWRSLRIIWRQSIDRRSMMELVLLSKLKGGKLKKSRT